MNQLLQFLTKNKEWIFSGIGVAVISALFWLMKWLISPRNKTHKRAKVTNRKNVVTADGSIITGNVAGRDLYLLKQYKQYSNLSGNVHFVIKVGHSSMSNWSEVNKLPKTFSISEFEQTCSQYFKVSGFMQDIEPSFDITLVNETGTALVINKLGIEIKCVSHIWLCYGEPQATKIIQQASYSIPVPDIRSEIGDHLGHFPRLLEPTEVNRKIVIDIPDPWRVESESTFRYELLLKNFISHMPNYSIICFWVETHKQVFRSELIGMHTL
jgi:hypothetical protein